MAESILWAEDLPPQCPPDNAYAPQTASFYRLVETVPPQERDFWSQRKLNPDKKFNTTECVARSCSVLSDLDACTQLTKLPTQSNKRIVQISLTPESGLIKQTGKNLYHFSWWRAGNFDPISGSAEVRSADLGSQ